MSNLSAKIQDIIEERRTIMFEIERMLFTKRYMLSKKHINIFAVQSISTIYSIWEGFIQKSFQLYIDEINNSGINFNQFSNEIIIHHMENTFLQLREYPKNQRLKVQFFSKLEKFYDINTQIISKTIRTESNVSFEVLNKLLHTFSLEQFPECWGNYNHPKPNLERTMFYFLKIRNNVAHGGEVSPEDVVTHDVYKKYRDLVLDLMYSIHDKMIFGLTNETFKKPVITEM